MNEGGALLVRTNYVSRWESWSIPGEEEQWARGKQKHTESARRGKREY